MKLVLIAIAVILATGCVAHVKVEASTHAAPPQSPVMGLHVRSDSLAGLVVAGMLIAGVMEQARDPRPFPSFGSFAEWLRGTPPVPLASDRPVNEQECTKPIELTGNLKCR